MLGISAFLCLASLIWVPKGRENIPGGAGDPLVWGFGAFPVLLSFFAINIVWLGFVLVRLVRRSDWFSFIIWLSIIALWYGAVILDHSRHSTYDDSESTTLARSSDYGPG
jgi:hypothetical protein